VRYRLLHEEYRLEEDESGTGWNRRSTDRVQEEYRYEKDECGTGLYMRSTYQIQEE
jgi:hypothetical protein